MSYILYYSPGAASMSTHWALLQMGVPFEARLIDIDKGQQRTADYLKLNPAGRVPTLVVDGVPHHESVALLMLLAERHPEFGLAPQPGDKGRADWLELMVYFANMLLPPMRDWFYADSDGDPAGADAVRALATRRIEAVWQTLDRRLSDGRAYLLGDKLSLADFQATMLMRWSRNMPRPATGWPHLAAYVERMRAMPSFVELCRREGLSDWMNPAPAA